MKRLPYGVCDFRSVRESNLYYEDKIVLVRTAKKFHGCQSILVWLNSMTLHVKRCGFIGVLLIVGSLCAIATPSAEAELDTLDALILRQQDIIRRRQQDIQVITELLEKTPISDTERYMIYDRLYEEYHALKYDSAYKYSELAMALADRMGDRQRWLHSALKQVHILSVAGLFGEAEELLQAVDTASLSVDDHVRYLDACCEYTLYKVEFYQGTKFYDSYSRQLADCRRRILATASKGSFEYTVTLASYECQQQHYDRAIALLERLLSSLTEGTRPYSIVTSTLGFFFQYKGDERMRRYYLTLSAISDLRGGITENNSMRELSTVLLSEGDVERASRYLNISVNDAAFYGTRLRNVQASSLLPQIEGAYNAYKTATERNRHVLLTTVSIVAVLLVGVLAVIVMLLKKYRQANARKHEANVHLNELVGQLKSLNGQIVEHDQLKEQYISRFLQLASHFIDLSVDEMKQLNRLAREGKVQEIYNELKSNTHKQTMESEFFENFDTAFLAIYPHFVSQVNTLLLPEARIELRDERRMTTELRIYALIRLGITDNASIANILRSSMTTIYTYRSKLKGKAIDRQTFEESVKNIDAYE